MGSPCCVLVTGGLCKHSSRRLSWLWSTSSASLREHRYEFLAVAAAAAALVGCPVVAPQLPLPHRRRSVRRRSVANNRVLAAAPATATASTVPGALVADTSSTANDWRPPLAVLCEDLVGLLPGADVFAAILPPAACRLLAALLQRPELTPAASSHQWCAAGSWHGDVYDPHRLL